LKTSQYDTGFVYPSIDVDSAAMEANVSGQQAPSTGCADAVTIADSETYLTTSMSPPQFNQLFLIKSIVLLMMFVISLAGNASIVVQLARRCGHRWNTFARRRRNTPGSRGGGLPVVLVHVPSPSAPPGSGLGTIELLIGNLAASDLFVTFFCNVTDAVWVSTIQWYAGNVGCKLIKYLQLCGLYSSTYITVVIAIDRCSAVLDPMRGRAAARRRVCIMIAVSWLLSAIFSLPQVSLSVARFAQRRPCLLVSSRDFCDLKRFVESSHEPGMPLAEFLSYIRFMKCHSDKFLDTNWRN
jgi:hypothetical protein